MLYKCYEFLFLIFGFHHLIQYFYYAPRIVSSTFDLTMVGIPIFVMYMSIGATIAIRFEHDLIHDAPTAKAPSVAHDHYLF